MYHVLDNAGLAHGKPMQSYLCMLVMARNGGSLGGVADLNVALVRCLVLYFYYAIRFSNVEQILTAVTAKGCAR